MLSSSPVCHTSPSPLPLLTPPTYNRRFPSNPPPFSISQPPPRHPAVSHTSSFPNAWFAGELMAVKQIVYGGASTSSAVLLNAQALHRELITLQVESPEQHAPRTPPQVCPSLTPAHRLAFAPQLPLLFHRSARRI